MIRGNESKRLRDGEYKGVRRKRGKWVSEVRLPRTKIRLWLGSHDTAEQAARAFDAACYCIHGDLAVLNFSDSPWLGKIPCRINLSPEQIQNVAFEAATTQQSLQIEDNASEVVDNSAASDESEFESNQLSNVFQYLLCGADDDQLSSMIYISRYLGVVLTMDCIIDCDYCYDNVCCSHDFMETEESLWTS